MAPHVQRLLDRVLPDLLKDLPAVHLPEQRRALGLASYLEQVLTRDVPQTAGMVLHTGPRVFTIDDRVVAEPIASLWS